MSYLCRKCSCQVEFNDHSAFCANCNKELTASETISSWKLQARMEQLQAMHTLMRNANDEQIYMIWIVDGVPDEPSTEDFEYIAMSDNLYNECFDLLLKLIVYDNNRW